MEFYRGILLANAAWGTERRWIAKWDDVKKPITHFVADWPTQFHVWRMNWNHDAIQLYLDDELLNEVDLNQTINADSQGTNPFRQPHYILLNLATDL
jgi:hypothetical protein